VSEPLIDSHIHFSAYDRLNELEQYRQKLGAEKICVLSLPLRGRINFNPEVLLAKVSLDARYYGLASFDYSPLFYGRSGSGGEASAAGASGDVEPTGANLCEQVERFREVGFDGLKIYLGKPTFQSELGIKLTDPEVLEALQRAGRLGMPALIHIADPLIFWSYQSVPGFIPPGWEEAASGGRGAAGIPSYEELQHQAVEVLRACPDLTVIFPHLLSMGQDLSRLAGILDRYPGAYLDLAPGLYFYYELDRQRKAAREFFGSYAERILFGTDSFWFPEWFTEFPQATVEDNLRRGRQLLRFLATEEESDNPFFPTRRIQARVRGLGLGEQILRKIRYDNFLRLYPGSSRKIDGPACLEYLDDFVGRLKAGEAEAQIQANAAELKRQMEELFRGGFP
jgi:predicted TIM-barrel fold metal-dependent hydrolase